MGNIHVLSSDTINKIAAGEVIERPASIVKELVENSIDSGANSITIEIMNGGISFIRVTDNGCGFEKEDIPTAFLRHATSKIRVDSDLLHIVSLGFRGEALSSIASVSKVELLTKQKSDFLGCRYVINGGEELVNESAGCPDGTTFLIRDLFYNVPARRKFLKSATTEAGYINELVNRLAVSHPYISFSFVIQGRTVLHTSGNGNLKDCIYSVFGKEIASNLISVSYECDDFSVSGFLGKSVINRGNRNYELFFVNGRSVRSNLLYKAIEEAYSSYLMLHKYPFTVLLFSFNPETIDVNIHPTKMDVRFSDQETLCEKIRTVLSEAIRNAVLIPKVSLVEESVTTVLPKQPEYFETNRKQMESNQTDTKTLANRFEKYTDETKQIVTNKYDSNISDSDTSEKDKDVRNTSEMIPDVNTKVSSSEAVNVCEDTVSRGLDAYRLIQESTTNRATAVSDCVTSYAGAKPEQLSFIQNVSSVEEQTKESNVDADFEKLKVVPQFRILGQVFKTYWIVEKEQELFIIDQHAAHEKIIYESMVKAYKNAECFSQEIMPSIIISLSIREEECLLKYMDDFKAIGFDISPFGGRDYQISGVPSTLYKMDAGDYFISILDKLCDGGFSTPETVYETIASMSCKAAIKGNQQISETEARHLIEELLTLENPFHCPHGRPIIISMTQYELEKKFKRIV